MVAFVFPHMKSNLMLLPWINLVQVAKTEVETEPKAGKSGIRMGGHGDGCFAPPSANLFTPRSFNLSYIEIFRYISK